MVQQRCSSVACDNRAMASTNTPSGFNFSCTVQFPDGSSGEVCQTDTKRGERQDAAFFVTVHPQAKNSFTGVLHLAGSSSSNLDGGPGETGTDKSACVTNALGAWVREHNLQPDFTLEVTVDYVDGQSCRVSLSPR
jgi:hypothetical protein